MNLHAIRAIYIFELSRTWRTIMQSIASPVLSTSLYFVVFGSAIGGRMGQIDGVSYGAYIIPGLVMLSLLTESISNASFGIYMPKFSGTIYEVLSAPISWLEVVAGSVGAAATKSVILGVIILITARLFVAYEIQHPLVMLGFLVLTAFTFSLFGFILGVWADGFEKLQIVPMLIVTPLTFLGGAGGLSGQRLPLELLWRIGRRGGDQHRRHLRLHGALPGRHLLDLQDRLSPEGVTAGTGSDNRITPIGTCPRGSCRDRCRRSPGSLRAA